MNRRNTLENAQVLNILVNVNSNLSQIFNKDIIKAIRAKTTEIIESIK